MLPSKGGASTSLLGLRTLEVLATKPTKLRSLILSFGVLGLILWGSSVGLAAELQKIRIAYSNRSFSVTTFEVARVKGFFQKEGLEVEMIQVNPRLGAVAVMNGDLDFTSTFASTLRGILAGLPMKFAAVFVKKSGYFLVVRPEIREAQDLKGKRLGVATLLGTDQRAAEEMLRSKGLDPAQLQILALGDASVRGQALRSGLVEAISVSPPEDLNLRGMGFRVLAGPQDMKWALPTGGFALTNRLLQEKPQLVKQTLRALLKAHHFIFENRQETTEVIMRWLRQSPEVASHSYEVFLISASPDGEISDQEMERLTEKRRPLPEVRDFSLLRQVRSEMGMK